MALGKKYRIEIKRRAVKQLAKLPRKNRQFILTKLTDLKDDLKGDVKHLTNFTPEYRLRVGDYRVLFEIEEDTIIIYHIKHRKEAYR